MTPRNVARLSGFVAAGRIARFCAWLALAGGFLAAMWQGPPAILLGVVAFLAFRAAAPGVPPDLERDVFGPE